MGSRIGKAIYKNERQRVVTGSQAAEAVRFFSAALYIVATIFSGYIQDIDIIIDRPLKEYYHVNDGSYFSVVQNLSILMSIVVLSVLCSIGTHRLIILKCIALSVASQITLYVALSRKWLSLMLLGQIAGQVSDVGLIICALSFVKQNQDRTDLSAILCGFFCCHDLGTRIARTLVPSIVSNNLFSVYVISILFAVLQLFCLTLVFIMEKVYLMKRKDHKTSQNMVVDAKNALQTMVMYKPKITTLIMILISQIRLGGMDKFTDNPLQGVELLWALGVYLLLICSFFSLEHSKKNYLALAVGLSIIVIHHLFPFDIPTMCLRVFFSGLNVYLVSKISSPAHFSLILGGLLLGNYLGKSLPSVALSPILAISAFFPLVVLYRLERKEYPTI